MADTMADSLRSSFSIFASTCRLVFSVLPPMIQIGVIDRSDCVLLGAVIGIVVAARSIRTGPD